MKTEQPFYYPDVCLEFAVDFFQRHREQPFFFYYPTHLIHNPILRTPDSKPGTTDPDALYEDNVAYLDKEVGRLVAALDALGLRERTIILFAGDNGTAKYGQEKGTIGGRQINGMKASMLEGGSRVPLIANWPGTIAGGRVSKDLVDFTDFLPTFAELGAPPRRAGSRSTAAASRRNCAARRAVRANGSTCSTTPRHEWYVREPGWKLTHKGELFDMSDAPFVEKPVAAGDSGEAATAARGRLQAVLDKLNPAAGKLVPADRKPSKKKKKKPAAK